MAKLDLFKQEWLDMLFEGRNKSYGAYELRAEAPKILTTSFFIGATVFVAAIVSPLLFAGNDNENVEQDVVLVTMADIEMPDIPEIPEIEEELPPPPPPPPAEEPAKSVNDEVKFTEPEIVKAEEVKEEIATVEDLKKADPGQKTQEGDKEKGEIKVAERTGEADKGKGTSGGDGDGNQIYYAVEKSAQPAGGLPSFYKSFASKFNAPEVDEGVRQIRVMLQFVVEKDGSFTDIKVLRDPGYGAGREAMRVLRSMPKWTPAEQNGRKVRSQFTLPITINVQ
ncbi:energy transducer TonB [Flavobacterium agricola]|uniref:Energy transducer TonB n=1 Tax=Flavobacterium agricola TaxID=2870839 RepID=A0ABY6LYX2_9FLAO|nr:energy transducer TonB [Flavobacterium agricola]UYW00630.1 energy transducer TonB [Flavobacterium agricola]